MNNGLPEEDLGFFNEVSFPDIGEFGLGWDPQKVRRKREAREFPYYYEQRRPPAPRRQRQHGQRQFSRPPPASHSNRRKGPGGFWDDPDFDADFFSGGPPQPNNFDSYTNSKYQQQQPRPQQHSYYPQQQSRPQYPDYPETPRAYRPRPQPKPQRPKIKPTRVSHHSGPFILLTTRMFQYVDRYSISENSFNSLEQDNSILGSGNFDILKGGTFYDKDDYLRPYRYLFTEH